MYFIVTSCTEIAPLVYLITCYTKVDIKLLKKQFHNFGLVNLFWFAFDDASPVTTFGFY